MSTVSPTTSNYIIQPNTIQGTDDPQSLDSNDFMELMMTQLQNQNPMEPMENTDYIAQMAEFSALEQMQSMNTSINTMYAFGLMGKEVTVDKGDGTTVTGIVETVAMESGSNYIEIDGVKYDSISVISATVPTGTEQISSEEVDAS